MRNTEKDTYRAECVCGATVESQSREMACPRCGRKLRFEWGREPDVFKDGRGHGQEEK